MQFAVVNNSKTLDSRDVEFMVAACAAQVLDFCRDWGVDPITAALYSDISQLPMYDTWPCEILDSLDEPGALGYHSSVGDRPVLRILAQGAATSITLSHEFLETLGDPTCDRWMAKGDGTEIAVEVCDPVEGDSYPVVAEVAGEGRTVEVSNYLLPPYFDRTQGGANSNTNKMGLPLEAFGLRPGGYYVQLGRDGNETEVFGRLGRHALAKLARPDSRLSRRLNRKVTP